jgi:hypothetical protein
MAGRISTPFAAPRYDNRDYTRSMSQLIRGRGDIEAQAALERGRNSANLGANIANIANSVAGQIGNYYADKPRQEALAAEAQERTDEIGRKTAAREALANAPKREDGSFDFKAITAAMIEAHADPEVTARFAQQATEQDKAKVAEQLRKDQMAMLYPSRRAGAGDEATSPPPSGRRTYDVAWLGEAVEGGSDCA